MTAAPVLSVEGLVTRFGGFVAVDGVSLTIAPGEIVGLIGANGAGKTSLLHSIYGRHRVAAGTVHLHGEDITSLSPRERARRGMGLVFQTTSVFPSLSVEENLRLGAMPKRGRGSHGDPDAIAATLEMIDLVPQRAVPADALAHGQQQWLEIGMALLAEPRLLFLDEPTSGMTRAESRRTAGLIRGLQAANPDRSIIVVEHNLEFVRLISDRVLVMHRGRMIADGTINEVQANPDVQASYLGRLG
jgi:urea transport system ATP-binding protein